MNLATLTTEAQRLAGRVDSNWNARTKRWLNDAQKEWAAAVPWPTLVKEETFLADGTHNLILPQRVSTVVWAGDKTNYTDLKPARFWDKEWPASFFQRTSGKAQFWRPLGTVATIREPTYGQIKIKTTVTDVTTVYLAGLTVNTDASGTAEHYTFVDEEVLVSDLSVTSSTKFFYRLDTIGKDDYTDADFEVWDSSSNVLARMRAKATRSEYQKIELIHVPAAGTEIVVQYLTEPEKLVANNQIPHASVDTEYLIWHAAATIHDAQGQAQEAVLKRAHAKEILERRIHQLKSFGDKDHRALPEYSYWNFEDDMEVGI